MICGNKVPTLTFDVPGHEPSDAAHLWVALANSFAVDWLARRVVTTSMNYFVLRSLPLPRLPSEQAKQVIGWSRALAAAEVHGDVDPWSVAELRALIDSVVAHAFGLVASDLALIMKDFRLLDRGQPALPGEERSTVTRDAVLAAFAELVREDGASWRARVDGARAVGAVPYIPADYVV
jgi:hypothetical protein